MGVAPEEELESQGADEDAGMKYPRCGRSGRQSESRWAIFRKFLFVATSISTISNHSFQAIFDDGHDRQLPGLVTGPLKYKTYAYDNLRKSMPYAKGHPMKQAVVAPSMLYLLYPLQGQVERYSKEEFVKDLVNEVSPNVNSARGPAP